MRYVLRFLTVILPHPTKFCQYFILLIENFNLYSDEDGVKHIRIKARPNKWHENDCPFCHKSCPAYDKHSSRPTTWRGLDWETVGRCVNRALHDLEPERSRRLDGLVNIGIDETSYKKGHKYITVIVNHDTNTVVWASEDHGKSVLEKFYKQLTPEQLSSIKVVTGDGAKWITECVNEYTPDCAHCVDSFHVIEWAMTALDEVRKDIWHDAYSEYKQVKKDNPCSKGRPKKDDPELAIVKAAKAKADEIKGSAYMIKVLCFLFDTKYHMHYIISF